MLPISDSPPASQGLVAAAAAEALCQEDTTTLPPALSALLEPAKNAAALGLYGAVIDSSGTFLAHGSSSIVRSGVVASADGRQVSVRPPWR